jgi:hypothetical protein
MINTKKENENEKRKRKRNEGEKGGGGRLERRRLKDKIDEDGREK